MGTLSLVTQIYHNHMPDVKYEKLFVNKYKMSLTQIQSAYVWKSEFQSLKMPDWEQLVNIGVADAWRVVRKEVFQSISSSTSAY